jgi:PAS domain S-box-containing protein
MMKKNTPDKKPPLKKASPRSSRATSASRKEAQNRASSVACSRTVLDDMLEGCQIVGFDWRYVYLNDAATKAARLPKNRLLGRTIMESYPGIENTEMFAALKRCMNDRTHEQFENAFAYPDGEKRFFELSIHPVPEGIFVLSMDITERKQAEETLREGEEELLAIYNNTPLMMFVLDRDRRVLKTNRSAEEFTGRPHQESAGRRGGEIFHCIHHLVDEKGCGYSPHCHDCTVRNTVLKTFETGQPSRNVECTLSVDLHGKREDLSLLLSTAPLDVSNTRKALVCIENVTDRKRIENELRENRQDLNRAQAVAHTGSWRLDTQKNELVWSDEAYRIFGMPRDVRLTYESFLAAVHPEDRARVDERWQAALRGEPYDIEHRIVVGGETKWVRERAELDFAQTGNLLGGFGTVQDITELKHAMEHIEFLSQFPSQNPNPVMRLNRDGTVAYANDAARPLMEELGYQSGGKVDGQFLDSLNRSVDTNKDLQMEKASQGKTFSFLFHPSPDGTYANVYGMDITARKKLVQSLGKRTRELHTHVKHLNCIFSISDLIEEPGSSLDAILQGTCDLLPKAMQYPQNACVRIIFAGLKFETAHFRETSLKLSHPLRRNGETLGAMEICYLEDAIAAEENPFLDEEAALVGDVAKRLEWAIERKHWTEELRRSKEMLENISHGISEGLFLLSKDYRVIWANRAAMERSHFNPQNVISCHCYELLHENDTPCHENGEPCPLVEMLHTGKPSTILHDHLDDQAERHVIETTAYPLKDQNGEVQQIIHLSRDVTENKRAEESLKAAHEQLIKLNQVRSEFTSMVSHELRTPLGSIKESIDIVLEGLDGPLTPDQTETLGIAKRNVDRLARLINNILDLSKLESGRMEVDVETTDMNAIISETCELMRPAIDRHALEFSVEVPPEHVMASCDPDKIKQVLTNLLDNAVKFTQPGGRIAVRLWKDGDKARIDVQDSGIGIKEEDIERIFETFTQAQHDGMRKAGGSGLGLTISRRILELHGGTIAVASARGEGSTFSIILPAQA